ncbi:MAG: secretin N-terminal domain-containing protein, partial [Limisphaerales bacterium]
MKNIRVVLLLGLTLQGVSQVQAQLPPPPSRPPRTVPATPGSPARPATQNQLPGGTATPTTQPPALTTPTTPPTITDPDVETTPLNLENMPLAQVLDIYSELVDRTILRSTQLPVTQFITLRTRGRITRAEAITALETVMAMNGITIIPVGDRFIKVVPGAEAGTQGAAFSKADPADLPVAGRYVTQIVPLKFISAQDAVTAITPFASMRTGTSIIPIASSQTLILRDYSENIKRMMEVVEQVDRITPLEVQPELIPIKYALAAEIATVLGSLTSGGGAGVTVGAGSRAGLTGRAGATYSPGTTGQPGAIPGQATGAAGIGSAATAGRSNFQNR